MDQNPDQTQATPKQQLIERVRSAVNVLVTVRSNPGVDELSAAIGLTLMLNKLGKHATAVFSGAVPSTIEFLKPEETLEQNTDSLRDFIVSLDKSKADKLRYKVEENVVKIFITPYRTSITEKDLEFTQGDFNVDVVIALGVTAREELDQAITAHGRILHDATVVTVTAGQRESTLGSLNWQEAGASSLCEMLVSISEAFQGGIIDEQMATAFLTGIVAETERFSNQKTTPKVMTMSAQLMAAGANQQLIANELQKVEELTPNQPVDLPHEESAPVAATGNDGSLTINHAVTDIPEDPPQQSAIQETDTLANVQDMGSNPTDSKAQDQHENADKTDDAVDATETFNKTYIEPVAPVEPADSFEPLLPGMSDATTMTSQADNTQESADIFNPQPKPATNESQIHIDEQGNILRANPPTQPRHKVIEPLSSAEPEATEQGGEISLDDQIEKLSNLMHQPEIHAEINDVKATDPAHILETSALPELSLPAVAPQANPETAISNSYGGQQTDQMTAPAPLPDLTQQSLPPKVMQIPDETSLLDIEKSVHSPHLGLTENPVEDSAAVIDSARSAVHDAISQAGYDPARPEPRTDVGAMPLGLPATPYSQATPQAVPQGFDPSVVPQSQNSGASLPPPPIPPPMMPMQ